MAQFKLGSFLTLITWIFLLGSTTGENLTARPGQDVTLKCESPNNAPIIVLEWTRPDLQSPEYVFFYRNRLSDPTYQNPSFAGRVDLLDRGMKNGDLSLILKNVSRTDSGTFECRFSTGGTRRSKRANVDTEPSSTVNLKVEESDAMDGGSHATDGNASAAVIATVVTLAIVVMLAVVIVGVRHHKRKIMWTTVQT